MKIIKKNSTVSGKVDPRINWKLFISLALVASVLAVLVQRQVELPSLVLLLSALVAFVFLAFQSISNPEVTIYALVIYLPFSKILVGDFGGMATALNFTNILTVLAIFGWIVSCVTKGVKFYERTSLDIPLIIFVLFGCLSLVRGSFFFGSHYFNEYLIPLKRWLTPIFLFFIVFNNVREKRVLKNIIVIIMFITALVALMAIKDYIDIEGKVSSLEKSRIGGISEQPNILAAFFVYYMFLYLGFYYVYWKKFSSWLLLIPFLLCFRGIQVTFSRGGYLAFAAALFAITFFRNKVLFLILTAFTIFALLNPIILPKGIHYRIYSTFGGEAIYSGVTTEVTDPSAARRLMIWKGAIEMIKDHKWFGVGYGVFPLMIPYYTPPEIKEVDAHNEYLLIAAEMGILALLVFLLLLLIVMKNTFRLYKSANEKFFKAMALGFLGCLGGVLIANIFGGRLDSQEISSYFWMLAALIFRALYIEREEAKLSALKRKPLTAIR